jgi:hypothetical protein
MMTTAVAERPTQAVGRIEPTEDNALTMLPAEWVPAVGFFLAARNHLIKSRLALCTSLKLWIAKGLVLEDAKRCFSAIAGPEFAMTHRFESDLMADLAAMVFAAIRRRKAFEDAKRRRSEQQGDRIVCGLAEAFRTPEAVS